MLDEVGRQDDAADVRTTLLALLTAATAACTASNVGGQIQDEPVCVDFELGQAKVAMKGSLKKPVKVTILEDDDVKWERVLLGRRKDSDPAQRFVVEDDDETYTVRWIQCPNVFAPSRVDETSSQKQKRKSPEGATYQCGDGKETKPYAAIELKVREGEASSRVVPWQAAPEPECWTSTSAAAEGEVEAEPSASASVEPPPPPPPPEPTASATASAVTTASAAPSASARPPSTASPKGKTPPP
jgi:hypothetical protein